MSSKAIEDILAVNVVTLGKARGSKGAARPQQSFLDGSILLAKRTGPEKIIKCQYIQQLLWVERIKGEELPGSEETEKLARDEGTLRNKIESPASEHVANPTFYQMFLIPV